MATIQGCVVLSCVLLCSVIAGCGASTSVSPDQEFIYRNDLNGILVTARQEGASSQQQQLLEEAISAGEMEYAVVEGAFLENVTCLENANFQVSVISPEEMYPGLLVPAAMIQPPAELTDAQFTETDRACSHRHYTFVNQFYIDQPRAVELYLQSFEDQRESIHACLREQGYELDDDVPAVELLYSVTEAVIAQVERGEERVRCWEGRNFSGFLRE